MRKRNGRFGRAPPELPRVPEPDDQPLFGCVNGDLVMAAGSVPAAACITPSRSPVPVAADRQVR